MKRFLLGIGLLVTSNAWAGGSITGSVTFQGILPPTKKTPVTLDAQVCGKEVSSSSLIVSKEGGVAYAVVFIDGKVSGVKRFQEPSGGYVLDQKGCDFHPHVLLIAPGATLRILNSDGILHNFHTYSRLNPPMNTAQPRSMAEMTARFEKPEIFEVRCDVHSWMQGWVVVQKNPYYSLTNREGAFRLDDVPAGDYILSLWHESLKTEPKRVVVREGEETQINFKLSDNQ